MKGSDLREGVVRVLSRDRQRVLGTGFLITERLVVTCWHVLDTLSDTERDAICLEVLQSHEKATARLRLDASSPTEVADLAVLALTHPLRGPSTPLPLGSAERSADHRFATFGFPRGFDDTGTWARGTIGYATGDGDFRKLLLHGSDIREGFSGSPLFDEQTRRVVGVVRFKAVASEAREAYATPTEQLLARCPELSASEDCPYRDLASFRESDARFWKGRGRVLNEQLLPLLARLPRFVEVSGPSGSGKSSLLHAGLIPALRDGTFIPGSQHWDVRALRPGLEPFAALDGAGLPAGEGLVARAQAWRAANPEPGKRLVLVIDPLEDVLLRGSAAELAQHQRFLQQLSALADESLPVTCVVALREGFDAVLSERAPRLRTLLGEHRVQVPSVLTPSELRDIIAGPAREVGLRFDPPEVVDSIALAAQEEFRVESGAGARVIVLPLLEVALTQLWQASRDGAMTLEAFNASAGLLGSLARWADGVYEPLKPSERRLADRLLLELVQLGEADSGLEDKGRRVPLEVLRGRLGEQAEVDAVLQVLVNGRLLVTAQDGHQQRETVELIHDALLTHWQRFVKLRTEDRAFRRWHEAVQADAERWWEAERAQHHQEAGHRLLRGEALTRAQAMVTLHPHQTSALAQRYVLRGQEAERSRYGRARRNSWLAVAASVAVLLAMGGLYRWVVDFRNQTEVDKATTAKQLSRQERISEAEAVLNLSRSPGLEVEALIRAIQLAGRPPPGPDDAREEVIDALTEATAAFLHAAPLTTEQHARTAALFSPDSRHLVTRGILFSPTIRFVSQLWDVRTASMLREFESFELCPKTQPEVCTEKIHADLLGEDTHSFGFSPSEGELWLGGLNGALTRWSPHGPRPSIPDAHKARITAISFSEKGDHVLSASLDGTARLWDATTGNLRRTLEHSEPCTQAVVSRDARYALVGGERRTCLFDLGSNSPPRWCFDTLDPGPSLAFSPSGKLAALGDRRGGGSILLVDVPSGTVRSTLTDVEGYALMPSFEDECGLSAFVETFHSAVTLRFCDDRSKIPPGRATAVPTKQRQWAPIERQGRLFHNGRRHFAISMEPDENNPFIRVPQSTARWMMRTAPFKKQKEKALLSPDGRTLLVYDAPGITRETIDFATWNHHIPHPLAVSPDARWLVELSPQDERLWFIDLETWQRTSLGDCDLTDAVLQQVRPAAVSRDGVFLAIRCGDPIQYWDTSRLGQGPSTAPPPIDAGLRHFALPGTWRWRKAARTASGPTESDDVFAPDVAHLRKTGGPGEAPCQTRRAFSPGSSVAFAPRGQHFAIDDRASIYLGSAIDCRLVQEAPLTTANIDSRGEPFSPDGQRFVTLSNAPHSSAMWDSTTGKRVAGLPTSEWPVVMAFSPDSKYFVLATASDLYWVGQVFLYEAKHGTQLPLEPIDGTVKALSFSPDSSRLIAVTDAAISILDPRTGTLVRRIDWRSDHTVKVHHARHRFGVADAGGRIQFWRTRDGQSVGVLHRELQSPGAVELLADAEGEHIVAVDPDGAYIFSLHPDELLRQSCALVRGRREYAGVQNLCDRFLSPANSLAGPSTP